MERKGVFITQKHFSPFLFFLSHRREMRWVKVTDTDNCISDRLCTITVNCIIVTDSHTFAGGDAKRNASAIAAVASVHEGAVRLNLRRDEIESLSASIQPARSVFLLLCHTYTNKR